jgi:hypothetical protein
MTTRPPQRRWGQTLTTRPPQRRWGQTLTADELRGMAALAAGGFAVFGVPAIAGLAALLLH